MTTVSNNVGLDNSWTAELVRNIDKRTTEGGFGNYVVGMGESALVVVASLIDAVTHAVWAPCSLLTGNVGGSVWHAARAVTHVIEAPLAIPAILVPRIAVATSGMLQITSRWEEQAAPANWKEKTIAVAKEGLEKFRNIPHAVLGAKIAGGVAVTGATGYAAHKFGLLDPVYNLLGLGAVKPEPTYWEQYAPDFAQTFVNNYAAPAFEYGVSGVETVQQKSVEWTYAEPSTLIGAGLGALALVNAYRVKNWGIRINIAKDGEKPNYRRKTPMMIGKAAGTRLWDNKGYIATIAIGTGLAQYLGLTNSYATAGIAAYTASKIVTR